MLPIEHRRSDFVYSSAAVVCAETTIIIIVAVVVAGVVVVVLIIVIGLVYCCGPRFRYMLVRRHIPVVHKLRPAGQKRPVTNREVAHNVQLE